MTTAKVRDSYRVLHFLRNNLYDSSYKPKVVHRSEDSVLDMEILKTRKFSVQDSSHYTDYSLRNLYSQNEHYLLDVEDMEKVYHKVRDELQMERPKVTIHQRTNQYAEIEKKFKENPEFREYLLNELRQKKKKREQSIKKQRMQAERSMQEIPEDKNEESSPNGKFKFKVTQAKGHKLKYEVVAVAKKDLVMKKTGQIDDKNGKDKDKDKSETSRGEGGVVINQDEGNQETDKEFFEIPMYRVDEMKKKEAYTPLLNENLDIEQRMMKRWNPPTWMNFTIGQVRRNTKVTLNEFDRARGESEGRVVHNKAHGNKNDYNEGYSYTSDLLNMSEVKNYRELNFDREFVISLKSSSPTKPHVRLMSLLDKIEEKRQVFKKSMANNVAHRDINKNIIKRIDEYIKLNSSPNLKGKKKNDSPSPKNGTKNKRNSRVFDRPPEITPVRQHSSFNQVATETTSPDIVRRYTRKISRIAPMNNLLPKSPLRKNEPKTTPNIIIKTTDPDSEVFLTQTDNMTKDEPLKLPIQKRDSTLSVSIKPPSEERADSKQGNRSNSEASKLRVRHKTEFHNNNISIDSEIKSDKKTRFTKNPNYDEEGNMIRKVEVNCEEIEDKFNKTCQDFMKIKVESNQQFRAALNVIREDRPVTNMIRYKKYDSRYMYNKNIDYLREQAENERTRKFILNEEQRKEYDLMLDDIVREEQAPSKLKACIFFFNVFKGLLERGDVLDRQRFLSILDKIDDANSVNPIFLNVIERYCKLLNCPPDLIRNHMIKQKLHDFKEARRGNNFPEGLN